MSKDVLRLSTEADYEAALDEIEAYFDNEPRKGSSEADRFDRFAALIDDYEHRHWAIDSPRRPA